jgi:hypothetical protein
MEKSEQINELLAALSKAQSEMPPAEKDKFNPYFKSKYASLDSVWKACRVPLTKNGLSIIQPSSTTDDGLVRVQTILGHSSGQWMSETLTVTPKSKTVQDFGSATTYAKRYALSGMIGLTVDEDDDGNASSIKEVAGQNALKEPTTANVSSRMPEQAKKDNTPKQPGSQAADQLFEDFK